MTRADAQEMIQSLLSRGARATDDFLVGRRAHARRPRRRARGTRRASERGRCRSPATTTCPPPRCRSASTASRPRSCASCATTSSATRTARPCSTRSTASCGSAVRSAASPRGSTPHHAEVEPLAGHLGEQLVGVQALALAPELAQQVARLAAAEPLGPKRSTQHAAQVRLERPRAQVVGGVVAARRRRTGRSRAASRRRPRRPAAARRAPASRPAAARRRAAPARRRAWRRSGAGRRACSRARNPSVAVRRPRRPAPRAARPGPRSGARTGTRSPR